MKLPDDSAPWELDKSVTVGPIGGVSQVAAWVPMSVEMVREGDTTFRRLVLTSIDRQMNPWRYPDRNPLPKFEPFAVVVWCRKALAALRVARQRLRDAWSVLTGRETIYDPEDEW